LEHPQHRGVDDEPTEPPLPIEDAEETLQVTGRAGQVGLRDLDIVESNYGVDGEGSHTGALAHHLTMDLAVWRDIDDHVLDYPSGTTQPMARSQRSPALIVRLSGPGLR
jgi:hypothetical protein